MHCFRCMCCDFCPHVHPWFAHVPLANSTSSVHRLDLHSDNHEPKRPSTTNHSNVHTPHRISHLDGCRPRRPRARTFVLRSRHAHPIMPIAAPAVPRTYWRAPHDVTQGRARGQPLLPPLLLLSRRPGELQFPPGPHRVPERDPRNILVPRPGRLVRPVNE